ncbi:MAG: hypothetical protein V4649_09275, partial [Bacteroidota bacterium]
MGKGRQGGWECVACGEMLYVYSRFYMPHQEILALREVVGGTPTTAVSAWGDLFVLSALREVVGGDTNNGGICMGAICLCYQPCARLLAGTPTTAVSAWVRSVCVISPARGCWRGHQQRRYLHGCDLFVLSALREVVGGDTN